MNSNCAVDFQELLNKELSNPDFKKGFKKAEKRVKLQIQLNELLKSMGINDMFVDVKDMSEY